MQRPCADRSRVESCWERAVTPPGGIYVSWSHPSRAAARLRSVTSARIVLSCSSFSLIIPRLPTGILPNGVVAPLAQWIEHLPSKQRVGGSNPSRGTSSTAQEGGDRGVACHNA